MALLALLAMGCAPGRDYMWAAGLEPERRWSLTGFVGQHDDNRFLEIIRFQGGDFGSSYLAGVALNRQVATTLEHLDWELEASTYGHWGEQRLAELNAALVARWTWFPWDGWLDTSVAFGQGVSLASERPPLEGETRRLLNHLLAEIEIGRPGSHLSVVLRVHHRSGVFGLYSARGGSNFVNLGLRVRF